VEYTATIFRANSRTFAVCLLLLSSVLYSLILKTCAVPPKRLDFSEPQIPRFQFVYEQPSCSAFAGYNRRMVWKLSLPVLLFRPFTVPGYTECHGRVCSAPSYLQGTYLGNGLSQRSCRCAQSRQEFVIIVHNWLEKKPPCGLRRWTEAKHNHTPSG
jgi:hypothetical protein